MYFSSLRKLIGAAEEKGFYDIALMYLGALQYKGLCIVDGAGDGGRDVTCSRSDLRIQLSVRKDWEKKLNSEAALTLSSGRKHMMYVTNRSILPKAEAEFRASKYLYAGQVDVSIHDLNRISTTLTRPSRMRRAYEMLGASVTPTLHATTKEIAISSVLLFGEEAHELREQITYANIRAWLLRNPGSAVDVLVDEVARVLPGSDSTRAVRSALSRLRMAGRIQGTDKEIRLSSAEAEAMNSAEEEFLFALDTDIKAVQAITNLQRSEAETLIRLSIEILLKGSDFSGGGPVEEGFKAFLAEKGLTRRRKQIYECLSQTAIARQFQYGKTVDQIFTANTFDIYRALGGKTNVVMVLDTSVALPMLFGLEFKVATSRYAVAASSLLELCRAHEIKMMVPVAYVNEMAFHGIRALEYVQTYGALMDDLKSVLRGSGNAYLSHYSHIRESMMQAGVGVSLTDFLATFGLRNGVSLARVENRITSILEQQGIETGMSRYYDPKFRDEIASRKPYDSKYIVDHDAAVCTSLVREAEKGYILATWDRVMIEMVQDLARVYSDSPARVIDFLSMIEGLDYESTRSNELLTTLLHIDERVAERLARKLDMIESPEQAYKLRMFIEEARAKKGGAWMPDVDDLSHFLDTTSARETSIEQET